MTRLVAIFFVVFCISSFTLEKHVIHPAVGELAPEIALKAPDDSTVYKLSDLRGHVVLVDFWASWCRACRIENNSVRKAYQDYKDSKFETGNGFRVFSVSLDEDIDIWKKAIYNDRLDWEYHVSDFKKWKSPVVSQYNFRSLPFNVLIDGNGKIIAKGLYREKLQETLAGLVSD